MSQARLPRTEPSTELISAHKVNHRAAHVAGRAPGIFAGAGLHRGTTLTVDHTHNTHTPHTLTYTHTYPTLRMHGKV